MPLYKVNTGFGVSPSGLTIHTAVSVPSVTEYVLTVDLIGPVISIRVGLASNQ